MIKTNPDESVLIQAYDPAWPTAYSGLAARAKAALGDLAISIEHIGSTGVSGLAAKPVMDLDLIVASRDNIPEALGKEFDRHEVPSGTRCR
jgi:GrpB-like predicted nucleotidyltransferase (UPF0157 family)